MEHFLLDPWVEEAVFIILDEWWYSPNLWDQKSANYLFWNPQGMGVRKDIRNTSGSSSLVLRQFQTCRSRMSRLPQHPGEVLFPLCGDLSWPLEEEQWAEKWTEPEWASWDGRTLGPSIYTWGCPCLVYSVVEIRSYHSLYFFHNSQTMTVKDMLAPI